MVSPIESSLQAFAKMPRDTIDKLSSIKMREIESVAVFLNCFLSLLPQNAHMDCQFVHHNLISKLMARIQENQALLMFNDKRKMQEIVSVCDKAWKSFFATTSKNARQSTS